MTPHSTPIPSPVPARTPSEPDEVSPVADASAEPDEASRLLDRESEAATWVARPVVLPEGVVSKLPPPQPPPVRSAAASSARPPVPHDAPVLPTPPPFDADARFEADAPLPSFRLDTGEPMPVPARSASPQGHASTSAPYFGRRMLAGWRAHPRVVAAEASLAAKTDPRWLIGGAGYLVALALATVGLHAAATHEKTSEGAGAVLSGPREVARPTQALVSCTVQKRGRVLPHVVREVPVELRAFAGDRVWIGAASEANRAEGFIFDTSSLTAEPGIEVQSPKPVRRIASLGPSADELLVSAETDERRAWPLASFTPSIDGEARVDAVRTVKTAAGLAVVFRRQGEIQTALVDPAGHFRRPPVKLEGAAAGSPVNTPPNAGAPSVGYNGRDIAIVFADRATPEEPWRIRVARSGENEVPTRSRVFAIPAGGLGGAAITPAIAGLSDGRWLFAWTEGDTEHQVRALTLDAELNPVGEPFDISTRDTNAGQPILAISEGRGALAYLVAKRPTFELWVAGLACP